jgi:peptidase E
VITKKGIITIMGSGELTQSMVSVHKSLIQGLNPPVRAVFLDTPAGFQLNVDQISKKACDYFQSHIQQSMSVASFKSSNETISYEAEKAFKALREADYIMIGPGSPTYAVGHWKESSIPEIFIQRIEEGACLVVASAAALTVGRFTLPVYEIYKVGEDLHWIDGINILGHFGLNIVVVPHWNNAEGGTHDTRFCYMGESRFRKLESLLPEELPIVGLDEHTACIMDLEKWEGSVFGIGRMTIRFKQKERNYEKGERFRLEELFSLEFENKEKQEAIESYPSVLAIPNQREPFWEKVNSLENAFKDSLEENDSAGVTKALLELDKVIWEAQEDLENAEFVSQAREIMRELIVLLGLQLESMPTDKEGFLSSLMDAFLEVRDALRKSSQWELADGFRERLKEIGIIVEDTREGPRWKLIS